ncbi:MAG: hypothetical protein ACE5JB_03190 [bacterium]
MGKSSIWIICVILLANYLIGMAQENPHKNLNFNCEVCHVTTSWTDIMFNHNRTKFPLEDRHKEVDCKSCHNIEDFSTIGSNCISCHQDVHQAKMGGDCERCHTVQGWEIFNVEEIHANSRFPLLGRHTLVDCWSCHQNQQQGDFALLTTDCISCHQQEYLETENPNHVANSFSILCQECHDMNDWPPAFFPNHDALFPIFSGEHDGAWSDCMDCHRNSATFQEFSCLNCHEHRQSIMDEKHRGLSGYAYESNACWSCHPTGSEAGITENHDSDFFPIFSGTHQDAWQECVECHVSPQGFEVVSCINCHEHEPSKTNAEHSGITGYTYGTDNCLLCHPNGEKGEFRDHDNLFFPIFSGEHRNKWDNDCSICHTDPNNRKIFSCLNCHEHNQTKMDEKHRGKNDYVYESNACFDCHPDGKE